MKKRLLPAAAPVVVFPDVAADCAQVRIAVRRQHRIQQKRRYGTLQNIHNRIALGILFRVQPVINQPLRRFFFLGPFACIGHGFAQQLDLIFRMYLCRKISGDVVQETLSFRKRSLAAAKPADVGGVQRDGVRQFSSADADDAHEKIQFFRKHT
ncbi:MAG: hypothetical protein ACOX4E_07405 [Anaerovoracaceae bacterium]